MTTWRLMLFVAISLLGSGAPALAFAAGSTATVRCSTEQEAVVQALAAMRATPAASSTTAAHNVKADFKAKRHALMCCRSPKLSTCAR